jgi:squalene-hopene/tetraprenyl-beta-curcumene cyclase
MRTRSKLTLMIVPLVAAVTLAVPAAAQPGKGGGKTRDQAIDAAIAYLKTAQAEDGTWSKAASPGVTGIVLAGLLKTGKVAPDDPMAAKALKFVEGMADDKAGHLAAGEKVFHKNYITSVNLTALKATGLSKYDAIVANAAGYLRKARTTAASATAPAPGRTCRTPTSSSTD